MGPYTGYALIPQKAVITGVLMVGLAAAGIAVYAMYWTTGIISPGPCPLPAPPISLRTVSGSGELVFFAEYSRYMYSNSSPQAPVLDLSYELAQYREGDDHLGPGEVIRQGRLNSLNNTGDFQFHDMGAEGEFSPGNDFFILLNPPPLTIQLRILDPARKAIAWNMIIGCI